MLKQLIKSIALKFYRIGYFESLRLANLEKSKFLIDRAKLAEEIWISDQAVITNNTGNASKIEIGSRSRIMGNLLVFDFEGSIKIGEDCFIGPDTRIWSAKSISIGNRVLIAHNVNIHDNISHPLDAKERYLENAEFVKTGFHKQTDIKGESILIGDDVWIGFNTTILRGVKIGEGAVIGAGSLVKDDIEPWTVNIGIPSKVVRRLQPVQSITLNQQ